MSVRPIEIIGGGLAGLSLGLALRRAGVPVTIFEAGDYPRHRVCGEFITGLSAFTVSKLGLADILGDALRHREVAWFHREQSVRVQRLPEPALGLSRYLLDERLSRAFQGLGGDLRTKTRITDEHARPGRVFATGRRRGRPTWLGLKIHAFNLPLTRDLELHLGDEAYVGLSRVEEGRVNVCGLFRRRSLCAKGSDLLVGYLRAAGLDELAGRLDAVELDRASFTAVAALGFDRVVTKSNRVQLGDACAMIPPFTGNGMAMAFQGAEIALAPLVEFAHGRAEWPGTSRVIQDRMRRRFRVRLASASALHSYLLKPRRQNWLGLLGRARLLPLRPLYATLH
ncbi:MAG: putative electron transfer oxidoreductase [Verrucomicrobia bacterium]|nr:putative electron transfer oxidoreductase [Verrucomicrobiota bacterium]